jgi:hypothetical protein
MTWWFGETPIKYNPSVVWPSEFELMLHNRLYWYISWLAIYFIITLIVYIVFRAKKHEYPLIDALKISWTRWIIIALVLYFLYYIFVWSCTMCAYEL